MTGSEELETTPETDGVPGGALTGRVFDIQRFSIHDGPGIRTTVFLKGCPLRCLWCHNPEGLSGSQLISFRSEKCIACGECVRTCAHGAHRLEASDSAVVHLYDRERCEACGNCTQSCDTQALESVGRAMTVEEVMQEVRQDRAFYETSGGGLTVSGGEPLAQLNFTLALLSAAKNEGFHCCIETAGFVSWKRLQPLLPFVDLFLFDFKETDPERHAAFTGQSNEIILQNLRTLHEAGATIELQCPIVPGFNDREDHLAGVAALARSLPGLAGVRLLAYHPLGKSKLQRFGLIPAANAPSEPLGQARLEYWTNWLSGRGVRVLNINIASASAPPA